jgi:hypothetical protein
MVKRARLKKNMKVKKVRKNNKKHRAGKKFKKMVILKPARPIGISSPTKHRVHGRCHIALFKKNPV